MRVFFEHCDQATHQCFVKHSGDLPTMKITLVFHLRQMNAGLAPNNGNSLTIIGLLDTGATMTVIPKSHLPETVEKGADFEMVPIEGIGGIRIKVPAYQVDVTIGKRVVAKNVRVVVVPGQRDALIGRDVLDQFYLMVDPWRQTSALAKHFDGKVLSFLLNIIKGRNA